MESLLFTKEHEWVRITGESATIGITDFAQESLGDITFIDLPKVGQELTQFGLCATVESVKAASDIYSPLSGEVLKINEELVNKPELINKSPYDSGWIVEVKIKDLKEKDNLLGAEKYKEYLSTLSK
ncbi:MAG: glycine cleavage system protein GcvH [Candidatus Omnitrophota bacterium]